MAAGWLGLRARFGVKRQDLGRSAAGSGAAGTKAPPSTVAKGAVKRQVSKENPLRTLYLTAILSEVWYHWPCPVTGAILNINSIIRFLPFTYQQ